MEDNEKETTMEFNEDSEIIKKSNEKEIDENKEADEKEEIIKELVEEPENNNNNNKKTIIIFSTIIALLLVVILVLFILVINKPKDKAKDNKEDNTSIKQEDTDEKEEISEEEKEEENLIELPNLKNENKSYAESKLKELGLIVEFEYENSETINKDFVIGYKDNYDGDEIEVGENVIVIVSSGTKYITVGNYVGKDANTIKKQLEEKGIKVTLTIKKVTEANKITNGSIISQNITSGTKIEKGETIEFVYAQLIETYPDFTDGTHTKETILSFCNKNKITCTFTEKQSEKESGTILAQNVEKGTEVKEGSTLQIDIAQ